MTTEKKVDMLRRMMDGDETDEGILEAFLELAGQKILNRMYQFPEFWEDYEGSSTSRTESTGTTVRLTSPMRC